jgi:hypothetical protein
MRMFKRLAVTVAVAGVFLGRAAGVASASAASVHKQCPAGSVVSLTGGQTSVLTEPGPRPRTS